MTNLQSGVYNERQLCGHQSPLCAAPHWIIKDSKSIIETYAITILWKRLRYSTLTTIPKVQ